MAISAPLPKLSTILMVMMVFFLVAEMMTEARTLRSLVCLETMRGEREQAEEREREERERGERERERGHASHWRLLHIWC